MSDTSTSNSLALDLVDFIDQSPSPYHAVATVVRRLESNGFSALDERSEWNLTPGSRRYVVKSGGTVVAFVTGQKPPSHAGFLLIGAHTDSPNLRVKPEPDLRAQGAHQLAVEIYGGVLLSTWVDRDLSLAGRVSLRGGTSRLFRVDEPLCRIPNLAIHLNREVNSGGLTLNPQTQMLPILALDPLDQKPKLATLVGERLGVSPDEIVAWDLCLYDVTKGVLSGANRELIHSARLDNLASCHAATEALILAGNPGDTTRVIVLYDHEEVGSQSAQGAKSRFLMSVLDRIANSYADAGRDAASRAFAHSLVLSADMAHAIHPSYVDKHDKQHAPRLGKGPVIKVNANQSYATDAPSAAAFAEACREATGAAPQRFNSRNDMPCGSTIGPITAAATGIRTVDIGNPMLSMHSCREMAATADVEPMLKTLKLMFQKPTLPAPES
jgi:aspartyl aminopeptidase